jgi:hypothetical protein
LSPLEDLGPCLDALQEKTFRGCPPRFGYYRETKFETQKINVTFETLVFLKFFYLASF